MSLATIREVRSASRPRHSLATRTKSQRIRYAFPVTITDSSGRVRVVEGEIVRPKRGRKGRKRKTAKSKVYRVSAQVGKDSATGTLFDKWYK